MLLLLKTVGLDGTFDYVGRVVAHIPGEFTELSQHLWGEVDFPLIVLLDGHLVDYSWVDFCEAFGYDHMWNPAGRTNLLQPRRIESSPFGDENSFIHWLTGNTAIVGIDTGGDDEEVNSAPSNHPLPEPSTPDIQGAADVMPADAFDPANLEDARERTRRAIVQRRGQPQFRKQLLAAYKGRCAVTGCDAAEALEAAHIIGYLGPDTNHVSNGLLLRADIHTLFDLKLIAVDTQSLNLTVAVAPSLAGTVYGELAGKPLYIPRELEVCPNLEALDQHRASAAW